MGNQLFVETFQHILLNRIKDKKLWAQELAEVLNLSTAAIYKKARFESSYSLNEFLILCVAYNIHYEEIAQGYKPDFIKFRTPFFNTAVTSPLDYLKCLEGTFLNLKYIKNPKILYTTRELPIFYHLLNPFLTSFKLYCYSKTVWQLPQFIDAVYDHNMFDPEIFEIADRIWETYRSLHSDEFWTQNVLDITIQQLQYFWNCGKIGKVDFERLVQALFQVLDTCSRMTEYNSKCLNKSITNFNVYENKILHTSNHILVTGQQKEFMYLTFDNPNFLYTDDPKFIAYSKQWYEKIRLHSYSLGECTGHARFQFFNNLKLKLDSLMITAL